VQVAAADAIEQAGNVRRHEQLRIGEGIHQEHLVALRQRHLDVEH
jgi:hypothetical protein